MKKSGLSNCRERPLFLIFTEICGIGATRGGAYFYDPFVILVVLCNQFHPLLIVLIRLSEQNRIVSH